MPRRCPSSFLCLCLCAAGALAQPVPAKDGAQDGEREQRRTELRTALQVKPMPAQPDTGMDEAPVRQLSPIERAEMRQQLRQQQAQSKQPRP